MSSLSGILPVDKPVGPTSHDIVAIARRELGIHRIGHTGTLDPFASGLLLLCLGVATRLAEYLTALPKAYSATLRLGISTDTDDSQGKVVDETGAWREIDADRLRDALGRQTGAILQVPSAYSAKRVGGERMYERARRGEVVELPPVPVFVSRLELREFSPPDAELEVECSSGTYVRAIARDVGRDLGVGAHLTSLRRTRIGSFDVAEALPVTALEDASAVRAALIPPARAVGHLPAVRVTEAEIAALKHGRPIGRADEPDADAVALIGDGELLVAIATARDGEIRPRKVFA